MMSTTCRTIVLVTCVTFLGQADLHAATINEDGTVTLSWSATYIPFSWKFSLDPFPLENGSLSLDYDPRRMAPGVPDGQLPAIQSSDDYVVISQGILDAANGLISNIQFVAGPDGPPRGDTAIVFLANFQDLDPRATQNFDLPVFTFFAGPGDGLNFPNQDFSARPEFPPNLIIAGSGRVPPNLDVFPEPPAGPDGVVNTRDLVFACSRNLDPGPWLRQLNTLPGDVDFDGQVAFADFLVLSSNFAQPGGWTEGDFNCDGAVQFPDFLILSTNFGRAAGDVLANVPEPCGGICALCGALVCLRRRRPR